MGVLYVCLCSFSYYLWNISRPGKTGLPQHDLSDDPEAFIKTKDKSSSGTQIAYERIITKTFSHYSIPVLITPSVISTFRCKLWRMGKHWSALGSNKRSQQLEHWKDSMWEFCIGTVELNKQLLSKKRQVERELDKEVTKRRKLESEVTVLKETNKQQANAIMKSKNSYINPKKWSKCSRQQKYNRKKQVAGDIKSALNFCEMKGFKINSVELENSDTGKCEILDIKNGSFSEKENTSSSLNAVLYVKDKYAISNEAFHELSMVAHGLPKSSKVTKLAHSINSEFEIYPAPNRIVGVQQSLKARIMICLTSLSEITDLPSTIKIKLTGDGTRH